MIRLLYFSTAAYSVTKETVAEIVEQATAANSVHNITGALAYNGRNFCQLLEGEETAVRRLVANIIADDRHSGFKILDEKPITTRHFDSWSMQLVDRLDFSVVINTMEA